MMTETTSSDHTLPAVTRMTLPELMLKKQEQLMKVHRKVMADWNKGKYAAFKRGLKVEEELMQEMETILMEKW